MLPAAIEALRGRSKETDEAMRDGGWSTKSASLTEGKAQVKTSPCPNPNCQQTLSYTSIPAIVTCPKCGVLAFFGTPEQFQVIQSQIGQPKGESKPEETKGGALRESGIKSPPSSDTTSEDTSKPASD
jgi:hypothetical protein